MPGVSDNFLKPKKMLKNRLEALNPAQFEPNYIDVYGHKYTETRPNAQRPFLTVFTRRLPSEAA